MRTFGYWLSVVLLLFLGVAGLDGFVDDLHGVRTVGQGIATGGQLTFGLAGISAALGAILEKGWVGTVALVFALAAGLTAGLAPVVWGDSGIVTGTASGGLGLLMGAALYLGVKREEHTLPGEKRSSPGDVS